LNVRDDPLGGLIVALPPTAAALGFLLPNFPLDPIRLPGIALLFVVMADAPR
jgi:hypothetical protein